MSEHAGLALRSEKARKYPADVAPFSAVAETSEDALTQLATLLERGEKTYLWGDAPPNVPGVTVGEPFPVLQMVANGVPERASKSLGSEEEVVPLSAEDADAMVGLTDLAFPGYFRRRTYLMGHYYGIRLNGKLVAMAGERLVIPAAREVSGVCTHPAHTGRGYAAFLIGHLMREHATAGILSFLHVLPTNTRAIRLYERLGYLRTQEILFYPLTRD